MAQDYANNILEAIEMIAAKRVNEAGYDKTIKAVVTSADQAAKGQYTCKYESVTFTAIGTENAYKVDDTVMVNIPQNNWDNPKSILHKLYSEEIDYGSLDPFAEFLDVNDGKPSIVFLDSTIEEEGQQVEVGLKANLQQWTSRSLVNKDDFSTIYNEPFTRMGIEGSFKTLLKNYNVNAGTYGIRVIFTNSTTNTILAQYELNSLNSFGNLYGFEDYTPQKVLVKLDPSIISLATNVRIECFQMNDFTRYNTTTGATETLTYPGMSPEEVPFNILFKNLKLYFGYGKEEYSENDIILTTSSQPQYYNRWEEGKNTKVFSWVYWYKDSNGVLRRSFQDEGFYANLPNSYLEYCVNDKDWINVKGYYEDYPILIGHGGGEYSLVLQNELLDYPSIQFRIRMEKENFNSDSNQRYSNLQSNILTLYQYEPAITSEIIDETSAIQIDYEQKDKVVQGFTTHDKIYTELQYNDMENQLYTQYEFIHPHCINIKWEPTTSAFKEPNYLAGATITYKVPAFQYTEKILEETKQAQASKRFKFETTTVFMRPRAGYEYSSTNNTVRFETIDEVTYMVWDIKLSEDFLYNESKRNLTYNYGNTDQSNWETMQAFTLTFRPKEYYLPTMINNTIYCIIKKGDKEFTSSFEVPIKRVNLSETTNKAFIFTEDFEKPFITNKRINSITCTDEKVFHFCIYQNNYDGVVNQKGIINLMRPFGTGDSVKIFNESAGGFQKFLNRPNFNLGNYYWSKPYLADPVRWLPLTVFPGNLKYNFILRKYNPTGEVGNRIIYYLYYFNILGANSSSSEEFIPALDYTDDDDGDQVIHGGREYDDFETYYCKVWPFGENIPYNVYHKGERRIYEGQVYKCNDIHAPLHTWDPQYWDLVSNDIILPIVGTDYKWVQIGSPSAEECDDFRFRNNKYYIKTKNIFTLNNNIQCEFKHYATYFMESELSDSNMPINRYTVSLNNNKAAFIENDIVPILSNFLVDSQEEYFKQGYWYYDSNYNYVQSRYKAEEDIQWYTLKCPSLHVSNYAYLMLQTKINGIASIKEIPVFYDYNYHSNYTSHYLILNGMNKIYCDSTGVIKEKNMGPSEIPYVEADFFYTSDPIDSDKILRYLDHSSSISLVHYETTTENVLTPTIGLKTTEEDYYKIVPQGTIITQDDAALKRYYIKDDGDYVAGNTSSGGLIIWYDSLGEIIKQISLPYTVLSTDIIYLKDEIEISNYYLRYDNVGFTTNYKEVGYGNSYPAASAFMGALDQDLPSYYGLTSYLPIVFQQRQLFRDDFNQWSGDEVHIGEDAIFSPVVGAGRKNNGMFSGCLMGDISTIDFSQSSKTNYYGLYGYHENQQSFGLRADGNMFLGKAGNGQILLDGNKSTIQSSIYKTSKKNKGMCIDLDDAIISMMNNIMYYSQEEKEADLQRIQDLIDGQETIMDNYLPSLYDATGVWDYEEVPAEASYNANTEQYYVENEPSTVSDIFYYTQNEMLEQSTTKYYNQSEIGGYQPITIATKLSVYFPTSDITPNSHKTYYTATENKYVLTLDTTIISGITYYQRSGSGTEQDPYEYTATVPVSNPHAEGLYESIPLYVGVYIPSGGSFTPGIDYFERNYFYEKTSYSTYDNEMERVLFTGDAEDWTQMREHGTKFYTHIVGKTPSLANFVQTSDTTIKGGKIYYTRSGSAPDYQYDMVIDPTIGEIQNYYEPVYGNGPTEGYNIRVDDVDVNNTPYNYIPIGQEDSNPPPTNKYYLYSVKDTTNNTYNLDTYFNNTWMHHAENIDPSNTNSYSPYKIGISTSALEEIVAIRNAFPDLRMMYETKFSEAINSYNLYLSRINNLADSLNNYQANFINYYERDRNWAEAQATYNAALTTWNQAEEAFVLAEAAWGTAQEEYAQGQITQQEFKEAQEDYLQAVEDHENAYNIQMTAETNHTVAQENYTYADINQETSISNFNNLLRVKSDLILSYLTKINRVKPFFLSYNAYYVDNQNYQEYIDSYNNEYLKYLNYKVEYKEVEKTTPTEGIAYGIKIDASNSNITTSSGTIDKTKYPLKIGYLGEETKEKIANFKVNWAGEMFSTAGKIGGWEISSNKISVGSGSHKLELTSNAADYPLEIGDKFKVAWDGTITAKVINLDQGTLNGKINAKGTVIKNIKITNNKDKGLTLDGDDLKLDGDLVLVGGGNIRTESGAILQTTGSYFDIIGGDLQIEDGDLRVTSGKITTKELNSTKIVVSNGQLQVGSYYAAWKNLNFTTEQFSVKDTNGKVHQIYGLTRKPSNIRYLG